MMSSVAAYACFQVVFIAYCLASSRENTITRSGWPRSPSSRRRTSVWPSEPVPPVMRTFAPSRSPLTPRAPCGSSSIISGQDGASIPVAARKRAGSSERLMRGSSTRSTLQPRPSASFSATTRSYLLIGSEATWNRPSRLGCDTSSSSITAASARVVRPENQASAKPLTGLPAWEASHSSSPEARSSSQPMIDVRMVSAPGARTSPSSLLSPYRSRASGVSSSV